MVNSPQLAERIAASLGRPLTATLQHAKNLREAKGAESKGPLVTAGGRGRNAPTMSRMDAATLICAVLGSDAVQDSVKTVESMRKLAASFQGRRGRSRHYRPQGFIDPGIRQEHNVIEALSFVLGVFDRERELLDRLNPYESELYAVFEVEYPEHFASLTVGVRKRFSETWTYGRRNRGRNEQLRRCRQDALREIAEALRPVAESSEPK
jgi:hypothetical protein